MFPVFIFLIITIIFKNQGWCNNETTVSNDDLIGTRFTVSRFTISRCLRNPARRAMRNTETWHIVRQCEQSSATLPRRAKYSRAQIAIMGFRFPNFMVIAIPQIVAHYRSNFFLLLTTGDLSIEFRLHELTFAGRKIGNGSRNETRFFSPRQKNSRLDWTGALREVNYTGTRYRVSGDIDNILKFFFYNWVKAYSE